MKLQKSFGTLLVVGALGVSTQLLAVKPANAALLAQYTFQQNLNANVGTRANSAPTNPNYTVGTFNNSPGTVNSQYSTQTQTGTGRSLALTYGALVSTTKNDALNRSTFFSFTLTPTATYGAKFDQLSFLTDVGTGNASIKGNFFVQANLGADGAFVDLVSNGNTDGNTTYRQDSVNRTNTNTIPSFTQRTIDLTGFTANGNYFTNPIEFRFYEYDNAGGTSGGLRIDDVRLNGSVQPVPELSTGLLVALSLGGLCIVGLRRKKSSATPSMNLAF